jgi:hypothetical protein
MHPILGLLLMLSFLFLSNYGIHSYYKRQRKLLFAQIGDQKYIEIKNVDTTIYNKSKLALSMNFFMADVILVEHTLLILLQDHLMGLNQSILQFSKNIQAKKMNGVGTVWVIEKKEYKLNKINISFKSKGIVTATTEISLGFKNRTELNIAREFLNEHFE